MHRRVAHLMEVGAYKVLHLFSAHFYRNVFTSVLHMCISGRAQPFLGQLKVLSNVMKFHYKSLELLNI